MLAIHVQKQQVLPDTQNDSVTDKLHAFVSYLNNHISDSRPLYQYTLQTWKNVAFPRIVEHLTRDKRIRLSALERLSLQQDYALVYGNDGNTHTYWHLAMLMSAFEIQNVVCEMLQKSQASRIQTADTNLPLTDKCESCGQSIYTTCGCWFTKDGVTIEPYVVMPARVADEIWQRLSMDQITETQILDRLLQPDVIQTGTAFLDKHACAMLDLRIRKLWKQKVAFIVKDFFVQSANLADQYIAEGQTFFIGLNEHPAVDEMQLQQLINEYNKPFHAHCKTVAATKQHFVLDELLHVKLLYKYFTEETRGYSGPKLKSLQTSDLQQLAKEWYNFDVQAIVNYVAKWNEAQQMSLAPSMSGLQSPDQILLEINRSIRTNTSLDAYISRLSVKDIQDRMDAKVAEEKTKAKAAKEAAAEAKANRQKEDEQNQDDNQMWQPEELAVPGLVEAMRKFLFANTRLEAETTLQSLYDNYMLKLLQQNKKDERVLLLAFLFGIWEQDMFVKYVSWQQPIFMDIIRRKQYEQAIVKFIRYLLTKDKDVYEETWKHIELSKIKIKQPTGYDPTPWSGGLEPLNQVNDKQAGDANTITEAANFKWASEGGGSCAFDALFSGLFKMPNTWLQDRIFKATNVRAFNNQTCNPEILHAKIIDDILFLQGQLLGEQNRTCLTRSTFYKCLNAPYQTDDPQYLFSQLLSFYDLQESVSLYSIGNYRLSTLPKQNKTSLPQQIAAVAEYQMLFFEVQEPLRPLQTRSSVTFDIPEQIAIAGTNDAFVLMTCFITTGGHWLSFVRDYSNGNWWKFDAIRDPPYEQRGPGVPNEVLGRNEFQKPAAYLYVRIAKRRPQQQQQQNYEEILQELEQRPIAHKQQAMQVVFELRQLRSKVNDARLNQIIAEKEGESRTLPNWWTFEDTSSATIDKIRSDETYLESLGLRFINAEYVLQVPENVVKALPTPALLWLVTNVLKLENQEGQDRSLLQKLILTRTERLKGLLPSIFETIEHRPNVSVTFDLMHPLHNQIEQHWPVISQNTVWLPVFEKLQLAINQEKRFDYSTDELHNLANIARLLNHMDLNEPVPKELFQDVLKNLE